MSNSTDPGSAIQIRSSQDVKLINNTFYSIIGTAIHLSESSMLNMNNIFAGIHTDPFDLSNPPSVTYSAFWDYFPTVQDTIPGIGNIFSDPQFMSVDNNNFRLAQGSACINAGNPAPEYNDPDGSRNDMGAYGGPYADLSSTTSAQAVLSISSTDAAPGYQAVLPVESEFVAGVAEIKLAITYDQSLLQVEDVKTTDLTKSFTLTTDFSSDDSVKITLMSPVVITSQSGPLIQIIFRVNDEANIGNSTPVCIKHATLSSDVSDVLMIKELNDGQISIIKDPLNITATSDALPGDFELSQNYPNPFNTETRIRYGIPTNKANNELSIRIYNILGQFIRELAHGKPSPGYHTVTWNGKDAHGRTVPTGMYICVFRAGSEQRIRKMLLLK